MDQKGKIEVVCSRSNGSEKKGLTASQFFCAVRGHASFCLFVRLWCETIKIWGGIEGKVRNKKEEVGAEEEKKKLGEENKSLTFF